MTTTTVPTLSDVFSKFFQPVSPFDSIKRVTPSGREYWTARDLMELMGYAKWQSFKTPLERAMQTAKNQGHDLKSNFTGSRKVAGQSNNPQQDFELSRFACYLVAMNGDPNKPEVAAAQAYFAIQTRVAETTDANPVQDSLFADDALGLRIGKPVAELPLLPQLERAKFIDPRTTRNNKIAAVAREAAGQWVPVFITGHTTKQLQELAMAIRYGKRLSFPLGKYEAAVRDETLYIRHNQQKQVA